MATKRTFALGLVLTLCGCTSVTAEFKPPTGFLVSSYKAPLTIKADNIKIGRVRQRKYVTSFLWIPLGFPSIAVTDGFNSRPGAAVYADYEYFSVFGGLFQSVSVVTYDEKTDDQ